MFVQHRNDSHHNNWLLIRVVRKPAFRICENKDADQLRGNREADQRLCFRYTDSTIPLLSKSEISSLKPSSVAVQSGLCQTWSETPKTGFLTTRLYCFLQVQTVSWSLFNCSLTLHLSGYLNTIRRVLSPEPSHTHENR